MNMQGNEFFMILSAERKGVNLDFHNGMISFGKKMCFNHTYLAKKARMVIKF